MCDRRAPFKLEVTRNADTSKGGAFKRALSCSDPVSPPEWRSSLTHQYPDEVVAYRLDPTRNLLLLTTIPMLAGVVRDRWFNLVCSFYGLELTQHSDV